MEAEKIAKSILGVSKSVRVVTICDNNGKIVFTERPKSVKIKLSPSESRASLKNAAKSWKGRRAISRKIGKCKYVVAEYDKVKRITMPAGKNHLLFITTSTGLDANKIIRRVRQLR